MPTDPFAGADYVELETYEGKTVSLHRETWARKVRKHREQNLEHNFDKVGLTLWDPDCVVRSRHWSDSLLYFKEFRRFRGQETVVAPSGELRYLAVVVKGGRWVQSVYRARRLTKGEMVWPL